MSEYRFPRKYEAIVRVGTSSHYWLTHRGER